MSTASLLSAFLVVASTAYANDQQVAAHSTGSEGFVAAETTTEATDFRPLVSGKDEFVELDLPLSDAWSIGETIGLADTAVEIFGANWFDYSIAPGGTADRNYFELGLSIDLDRVGPLSLPNSHLALQFQNIRGSNGSGDVGDAMVFDNIDIGESRSQIAELFYEWQSVDEMVRWKFGKFDANSEFVFTDASGDFVNSGMGNHPTTFDTLPTYPDPAFAACLFVQTTEELQLGLGVFDGRLAEGVSTGREGLSLGGPYWMVVEARYEYSIGCERCRRKGRLALGGWSHTFSQFQRLDGSGTQDGQIGGYLYWDQELLAANSRSGILDDLHAFFSYGLGDKRVNTFPVAITAGLTSSSPLSGRGDDTMGIGIVRGQFSAHDPTPLSDAETAIESYYRCAIHPNVVVVSDLQFIDDPGGDSVRDDAWVGTMRVITEF